MNANARVNLVAVPRKSGTTGPVRTGSARAKGNTGLGLLFWKCEFVQGTATDLIIMSMQCLLSVRRPYLMISNALMLHALTMVLTTDG